MDRILEDISGYLKLSLEDKKLSRSERKALNEVFEDYIPDPGQLKLIRNKAFELARSESLGNDNQQIINWLEGIIKLLNNQEKKSTSHVFFSPGNDCLKAVIKALQDVRHKLDICVFTISDNRLSKEILACHKRGVDIRIITDDEKTLDQGSDIWWLAEEGINIKIDYTPYHMHHKFAIVDDENVITGSYNWTKSASEGNNENVIITRDESIVLGYRCEFEKLWLQMKKY
ncbi:MAG: phospholipase D-like domain-containing protein [Spirochaetes bacterium]|nr:phospholipase D-like domain-containing protein [Spirochaetota bacterium]